VALTGLDGSYTKARLHPYNFIQGATGLNTCTFDIDYTGNGSFDITGLTVDDWMDLSGVQVFNGAVMKITLSKATGDYTDTPSLQGYAFLVV
jgi:hypothetical protein